MECLQVQSFTFFTALVILLLIVWVIKMLATVSRHLRQEKPVHNMYGLYSWIVILLALILVLPWIFTTLFRAYNFEATGQIGDTIGGITAPFINGIGAILVYYSMRTQIKANEIIQGQIDEQRESTVINQLYDSLKENVDNFTYSTLDPEKFGDKELVTVKGGEAFYKLLHDFYCDFHGSDESNKTNPKLTELNGILELCDRLLAKLKAVKGSDKESLTILTHNLFNRKIIPKLNDIEDLSKYYCEGCQKTHGLPYEMVELIERIRKKVNS